MRLIKLRLINFRRFVGEHALDLNDDLVALVGPNEAGKSSILHALQLVGAQEMPGSSDRSRGATAAARVEALFVLDPDDRDLLNGIRGGSEVTHLWTSLIEGRERRVWDPEPRPTRDLSPRKAAGTLLDQLSGDPALDPAYSNEAWPWDKGVRDAVAQSFAFSTETLAEEAVGQFESLANRLRALEYPPRAEEAETEPELSDEAKEKAAHREVLATALGQLAQTEREQNPAQQIINSLSGRTPDVAFFREEDRELQSAYQFVEIVGDPPPALRNLCTLAGLDLQAVQVEITAGRLPSVVAIFDAANARLKDSFRSTWTQSEIHPHLTAPLDGVLRVMVSVEGGDGYSYPEERSDGLRWFLALHAFLVAHGAHDPILLVDEAETHLHYDAQADLIDMFMRQRIASKVVYTTHSVGCLPPDLGCGIRVVLAENRIGRSQIANSYWSVDTDSDTKVGYTPLLFGMGARLLSLTIPRFGVIVEGPADAILLPSLLRESAGLDRLPYRIVPGLSEVAEPSIPTLGQHAGVVLYLTDDDPGGQHVGDKLTSGGIDPAVIFSLGSIDAGRTLEDLVDETVFLEALNLELATWGQAPCTIAATKLVGSGRWKQLESDPASGVSGLSKVRVAQRVVDLGRLGEGAVSRRSIVNAADLLKLRELHERFCDSWVYPPLVRSAGSLAEPGYASS